MLIRPAVFKNLQHFENKKSLHPYRDERLRGTTLLAANAASLPGHNMMPVPV